MRLADTELDVSPLCLGANVFGWSLQDERSFEVLDAYVAAGGNFIDTADLYGRHGPGGEGSSEAIIGRWLAARGGREKLLIATKVGMGEARPGLSRENILAAAKDSAQRLGVETIDLYYAHRDDPDTPLAETLGAFAELQREGLIGHAAASNYSPERLAGALQTAADEGVEGYVALQPQYNLMERGEYEGPLAELCARAGLPCIPFFGLARGFLSGKYRRGGDVPDSPRAKGVLDSYGNERGFAVLDEVLAIAAAHEAVPAAVALAWLAAQPTVLSPIASATSPGQLAELMSMSAVQLSGDELGRLGAVSAQLSAR